jgi:glucosamine--fructose-6-phosphate aminotransferase (isomerizing)
VTTMDYYEAVGSQSARLQSSAQNVASALAEIDLAPWRNGLLAASSMGASSHASVVFVDRLARHGRRVVKIDASELMGLGSGSDFADSYVFASEGGRSRETIAAAQIAPRGRRLGLTNNPAAPFGEVVDAVIDLVHGEDSPVYTVGYTSTLQAFGLLASAIDGVDDGDDWSALPERVSETLASLAEKAAEVAMTFSRLSSFDFVGTGASFGTAAEAALLFREATRMCTAAFETYQYLHGPMEPLTSQVGCMLFGNTREVALARFLVGNGIPTVLITSGEVAEADGLAVMRIPELAATSRAVLEIVAAQLVVGELARIRGLGIDGFRYHQDDTKIDKL